MILQCLQIFSFQTYNYVSSSIRKESVVCLVAMIMLVGDELMAPYLSELNKGKVSFFLFFFFLEVVAKEEKLIQCLALWSGNLLADINN